MKRVILILTIGLILLQLSGCIRDLPWFQDEVLSDPEFTEEEMSLMDSLDLAPLEISEVILPNGESAKSYLERMDPDFLRDFRLKSDFPNYPPGETKNLLVARMSYVACILANRDNYIYPDEGYLKPAQYGLAYSYGSKQFNQRRKPPAGECKEKVYGLDCSGFVYTLFHFAGIEIIPGRADDQRKTDYLQSTLGSAFQNRFNVTVTDLGKISPFELQSGDIIYWTNGYRAYHIGMVLIGADKNLVIAHSTGTSRELCEPNYASIKRGVVLSNLLQLIENTDNPRFSTNYMIVRYQFGNPVELSINPDSLSGQVNKEYRFYPGLSGTPPFESECIWNFGDGSGEYGVPGSSSITHTFSTEGEFDVVCRLIDKSSGKEVVRDSAKAYIISEFLAELFSCKHLFVTFDADMTADTGHRVPQFVTADYQYKGDFVIQWSGLSFTLNFSYKEPPWGGTDTLLVSGYFGGTFSADGKVLEELTVHQQRTLTSNTGGYKYEDLVFTNIPYSYTNLFGPWYNQQGAEVGNHVLNVDITWYWKDLNRDEWILSNLNSISFDSQSPMPILWIAFNKY